MSRSLGPVQIGSIETFLRAAEQQSFAKAATELGLSAPAVSRTIARLEARLGVQLFARTTRQVRLTDDGRLYYEQCSQALRQIEAAEDILGGRRRAPSGRLRISVPTTYGHHRLLTALPAFRAQYPEIDLDIDVSNRNVDFVEEGFDLAVRLGIPEDNRLVARKIEDASLGIFATPAYLKARGHPKSVADIADHDTILFELPSTGRSLPWLMRVGGKDQDIDVKSAVRFSSDVLATVNYARAGGGLVQTYDFIVAADVAQGRLTEVLTRYRGRSRPFSILYPHNRHLSPKVRVFADFVVKLGKQVKPQKG